MKLIRFGSLGHEKCGVILADGSEIDVSAEFPNFDEAFFASDGLTRLDLACRERGSSFPRVPENVRLGCPINRPSKIVCIGMNYSDHAAELNIKRPSEPVVFLKATSALTGPHDGLSIPIGSKKMDWEVELAMVMKKTVTRVSIEDAVSCIAGYVLLNDYTEREWQFDRGGLWVKGKGGDTFAPLGPWLVTPDEVPDPHQLRLWLTVNGAIKQDGNTSNLIFNLPFLIHYVSQFMTLLPGDVLSTGTPAGVGFGMKPPQFVQPGDVIELGIDGLGRQRQTASSVV